MKFITATLLTTSASAKWGVWDSANYCDFNQEELATTSSVTSKAECADFCERSDMNALHIPYGTKECCDYEEWSSGNIDCTLYKGSDVMSNNYAGFSSMTFESGDYHYMALTGISKNEALSLRSQQCFEWNNKRWVGTAPRNPVYTECGLRTCTPCPAEPQCFEWNNKMWVGTAPRHPAFTECGLNTCTPCPTTVETRRTCFKWNNQWWMGTASRSPAFTVCGLEQCDPCKCFEWNNQRWVGEASSSPAFTVCGLETCNPCPM